MSCGPVLVGVDKSRGVKFQVCEDIDVAVVVRHLVGEEIDGRGVKRHGPSRLPYLC